MEVQGVNPPEDSGFSKKSLQLFSSCYQNKAEILGGRENIFLPPPTKLLGAHAPPLPTHI